MSSSTFIKDTPSSLPTDQTDGDEVLVRVERVSKKFCRDLKKSLLYGVKDVASELLPTRNKISKTQRSREALRSGEFWANKDISFELKRGECLGLIGHNGAGKTTLLRMLNGLIKPDTGRIEMRGRIGALIALGTGFNPILTGRENIFINGSVLGLSKAEIDEKIDEIIDFAEVGEFIDAPVQSYSSGMQVRLGFAVASSMAPDVLILDEVLAVGDAAFRNKCYERVGNLLESAAVILVTHNMAHIGRICNQVLVLDHGKNTYLGSAPGGISIYDQLSNKHLSPKSDQVMVSRPVETAKVLFSAEKLDYGKDLQLRLTVNSTESVPGCFGYIYFFDPSGNIVAQWQTEGEQRHFDLAVGSNDFEFSIGPVHLRRGIYQLSVVVKDYLGLKNLIWTDRMDNLEVEADFYGDAPYQIATAPSDK